MIVKLNLPNNSFTEIYAANSLSVSEAIRLFSFIRTVLFAENTNANAYIELNELSLPDSYLIPHFHGLKNINKTGRVAIVGEELWLKLWCKNLSLPPNLKLQFFDSKKRFSAWNWAHEKEKMTA